MYGVTLSGMAGLPGPGDSDADAPAGARPAAEEPPVTVLYSRRVKPGREAAFEAWAHGIVAASRQFPGHLGRLGAGRSRQPRVPHPVQLRRPQEPAGLAGLRGASAVV